MTSYVIATNKQAKKFVGNKIYYGEQGLIDAKIELERIRKESPDSADRYRVYPMNISLGSPIE